jgi:hypothetical protein
MWNEKLAAYLIEGVDAANRSDGNIYGPTNPESTSLSRSTDKSMKRTFAVVTLLASLGILIKLASRPTGPAGLVGSSPPVGSLETTRADRTPVEAVAKNEMLARYRTASPQVREMVARLAEQFGRNAEAIERTDGIRGLLLLEKLDMEALFLYEKYPLEFRRLRDLLGVEAAAEVLLHWREYFGLKHADETDRDTLIAEIAALTPSQLRAASRYPNALPLILADAPGITAMIERMSGDPAALGDASLEHGASDLRSALRTLDHHGPIALESFRLRGLEGFALVSLYGPVIESVGGAMPLEQTLILARVNADYLDELLLTHEPETVARHLRHVAATGLVEAVGGSPQALRLVVEQGESGERALRQAGPDAADVVFNDFGEATLRRQATVALAVHGAMALVILDKYATDPDFREVLRIHGADVIPPIAQADASPQTITYLKNKSRRSYKESLALAALFAAGENGQAVIRTIKDDGLERVAQLSDSSLQFYQFLPLYDVMHLGNVMRRGYAPTSGEMTWALIDGCFVVADVLSLAAAQPEGVVASEAIRSEVKGAVRQGVRTAGRELAEAGGEATVEALARQGAGNVSERLARWWTVRSAGGIYQIMRRLPEALPQLSLSQITQMVGPLCTKAGIRLTTWQPVRFLREGVEVVLRIPPQRGLKYLSAQALQAGVGVVGFRKMEEHLASRRPQNRER